MLHTHEHSIVNKHMTNKHFTFFKLSMCRINENPAKRIFPRIPYFTNSASLESLSKEKRFEIYN